MLGKFLRQVVATVSGWVTMLGFALAFRDQSKSLSVGWWTVLALSLVAVVTNILFDFWDFHNSRMKVFRGGNQEQKDQAVQQYMLDWMRSGGRTTILTRDLSWVHGDARDLLFDKADRGELSVLAAKETPLTKDLAKAGAVVCYYGGNGFIPKTRFTIIGDDKIGPSVLVGIPRGRDHVIERYLEDNSPVTSLARDLARYVKLTGQMDPDGPGRS